VFDTIFVNIETIHSGAGHLIFSASPSMLNCNIQSYFFSSEPLESRLALVVAQPVAIYWDQTLKNSNLIIGNNKYLKKNIPIESFGMNFSMYT
jgi:hypothetical protein